MIKVRLQIDDGEILDTQDAYGLVYVSADKRFEAPLKEIEKTSYPEQEGENSLNKTVRDAFDYKVEWFIQARNAVDNANSIIKAFNDQLYVQEGNVITFKRVSLYDDYKRVIIVGRPSLIQEANEFWRDANGRQHDVVKVEWTIRVTRPSLCNFNTESLDYEVFHVEEGEFYVQEGKFYVKSNK